MKIILETKIVKPNDNGKYDFHNNCIKASYLILGKLALTQMNAKTNKVVLIAKFNSCGKKSKPGKIGNQPPKNNNAVIKDIIIICEYSAKKNKAKVIPEYSTLKPDTNSDSASA
jgi:hypothetical protein|tara:strand:+ start:191 stop:532 length:342 start_codon:yes stop_codon:yes gene_type:complete